MKKKMAAVWLLAAALFFAGCIGGFDASAYVKGIMDNLYLGDSAGYRQMTDISEEEAAREYELGIEAETDFFLRYYGIGEISGGVREKIEELYRTIYSRSRYEVLEAVPVRDGYQVEVQISPVDVIVNSDADINAAVGAFVLEMDPADYADDRSLNDALAELVVDVITENLPKLGWQDPKSVIVKVEKDGEGRYALGSDAVSSLDQEIISY